MTQRTNVCPRGGLSKDRFQHLLSVAWGRVGPPMGLAAMAAGMGLGDSKTLSRALSCANLPEAHTVFNSLAADPTALDEVLAGYGMRLAPLTADAANDMTTMAGLSAVLHVLAEALADGRRDHHETLSIAAQLRGVMPALTALLREADALRGAA